MQLLYDLLLIICSKKHTRQKSLAVLNYYTIILCKNLIFTLSIDSLESSSIRLYKIESKVSSSIINNIHTIIRYYETRFTYIS